MFLMSGSHSGQVCTVVVPGNSGEALQRSIRALRLGGVIAFPTDTVYGAGVLAWDDLAVARLYQAKERPRSKPIPLLLPDRETLAQVALTVSPEIQRLAARFWPGPLTLVVARRPHVPDIVTSGGDKVAVRVPDHPLSLALLRSLGAPLAATSANRSGQTSPLTAGDVLDQLAGRIDLVIDGGPCPGGVPSTVVELHDGEVLILRPGPVTLREIQEALR
jgi:L-threonylcarbamoyladenylate synthase